MRLHYLLGLSTIVSVVLGGAPIESTLAVAPDDAARRVRLVKAQSQGNFKDAYEGFRKLALDPADDPRLVGDDLKRATQCLQRLNRAAEIDEFCEAVIDVHKGNWRVLYAAAQNYMNLPHHGFIVAGEFHRGRHRGGGRVVSAVERDRIRALQLMQQALPLARQDDNHREVGDYLLRFAGMLLNNRGHGEAWRLQYKSDLAVLPD